VGDRPPVSSGEQVRRVLLDTSVVIAPPEAGIASLAEQAAVSAITIAELEYGVGAAADPLERQRRRRRLQRTVDVLEVISFDIGIAESYGLMANMLRAGGRNPRPRRHDLLIAATAERHGLSLATRNIEDFRMLDRVLHVIEVR
jgi:predicted nucleic acid-binding protein